MLIAGVVLLFGLTLVYVSFDRAKMISQSAASSFIDRIADHTADRVGLAVQVRPWRPGNSSTVSVSRRRAIVQNPQLYALIAALLRSHKQLYNLYIGYDDGGFIELDLLDRAGPALRGETFYLSPNLEIIAGASREADYDPRERPWYRGAFEPGAGALTEPYAFKAVGLTGYTMRVPFTTGRRGIVAGDLLLTDTDAFLRAQKLGHSGVVFLFDIRGRVIAHPRMLEFTNASKPGAGALELPRLDQVEKVDIVNPLNAWRETSVSPQVFEDAGRTYVAAFRSVGTASSANLYLAVMAPLDEFFSEIES
jgi:adenylate cyclase